MHRIVIFILCLITLPAAYADKPKGYPFLPYDKAMAQAKQTGKPVFIYFGRYGCGYCDKTNKEAFSSGKVHEAYTKHYILAYVDSEGGKRIRLPSGERVTERDIGTRYNAFVTPVFSFINPEGEVLNRMIGVQRVEDLLNAHEEVQKKIKQSGS